MTNFLQNIKDPNSEHQQRMATVLLGGKGQQKRLYAVDETIYGTEEGARLQNEAQQKTATDKKKKKRRRKKRLNDTDSNEGIIDESSNVRTKQSIAAVAVLGAVAAAGASLFLGGKRSQ